MALFFAGIGLNAETVCRELIRRRIADHEAVRRVENDFGAFGHGIEKAVHAHNRRNFPRPGENRYVTRRPALLESDADEPRVLQGKSLGWLDVPRDEDCPRRDETSLGRLSRTGGAFKQVTEHAAERVLDVDGPFGKVCVARRAEQARSLVNLVLEHGFDIEKFRGQRYPDLRNEFRIGKHHQMCVENLGLLLVAFVKEKIDFPS